MGNASGGGEGLGRARATLEPHGSRGSVPGQHPRWGKELLPRARATSSPGDAEQHEDDALGSAWHWHRAPWRGARWRTTHPTAPRRSPKSCAEARRRVPPPLSALTCLVATSERFRRVQRQFCTSLGLELVRCLPKACMPPARETRHRAGYKYPDMQSVPSGEEKGAAAALSARRGRAGCLPTAASDARRRLVA